MSPRAAASGSETQAARRTRARKIDARLADAYPDAWCALRHEDAWQLLVATILSAQCTDERVNMVTPKLFARYPTPNASCRSSNIDAWKSRARPRPRWR